jgi:hypothetical protein
VGVDYKPFSFKYHTENSPAVRSTFGHQTIKLAIPMMGITTHAYAKKEIDKKDLGPMDCDKPVASES